MMKKIVLFFLGVVRRVISDFYTFLFNKMLHSYGDGLGVNEFCMVSSTATVDVGRKLSSNGLIITGLGGGGYRGLFS